MSTEAKLNDDALITKILLLAEQKDDSAEYYDFDEDELDD